MKFHDGLVADAYAASMGRVARGVHVLSFAPSPDPEPPTANGTHATAIGPDRGSRFLVSPAHSDVTSWLLAEESGGEADTRGLSAAAERVCQKLSRRLSRLVSPDGCKALLSRALHLARREFSFLEGVRAGAPPDVCLEGLDDRTHDVDASDARKGLLALLGTLLDLLVGFIGEDLTLCLVREVWTALPPRELSRPGTSDRQEAAP
jgi:hypothetical protein